MRPVLEGLEGRTLLATYSVTTVADSGAGSFRQAILDADAAPSVTNVITFSITAGSGVRTIMLDSPLPAITTAMTVDATTQPGYLGNPLIAIDGTNAGAGAAGLTITGSGSTVRGLVIGHFSGAGVSISTGGSNVLVKDFIGTNAVGLAANGNGGGGVVITNSSSNVIGGTTSQTADVISGNLGAGVDIIGNTSKGNSIEGSFIGADATGTTAIGNSGPGIEIDGASSNTIGSATSGGKNVISGNGQTGISLLAGASGNVVLGNDIGVSSAGNATLPNGVAGIEINASPSNTVGGVASGDTNVISGNAGSGISIDAASSTNELVLGNDIGVNSVSTAALPNTGDGVRISAGVNDTIGGVATGSGNVISGNSGNGVSILAGATGVVVQGNAIGTDSTGATALGNALEGVFLQASSTNTIGATANSTGAIGGAGNQIANNGIDGVYVASGVADTIRQNQTFTNTSLAIGLAASANNNLAAPTLITANTSGGTSTITGTYTGKSGSTYTLDFYTNPVLYPTLGQGKTYIGSTTVTPGTSGVASFTFDPANPAATNAIVSATATDSAGDTSQFSNQAIVKPPEVSLVVTGSGSVNPVGIGQTLVDTFVVTNNSGSSATNVTVADTLPSGVNVVMTTASLGVITLSGNSFSANLGTLAAGASATVTLSYVPLTPGTIVDTATATTTGQTQVNTAGATATITTVVQPSAYLLLMDSTSPASAAVGGLIAYYVTVLNKGPSPAAGVTISDAIPTAGGTIVSASTTQGPAPFSGGNVVASLGTIPANGSATVTIVVSPTAAGTLTDAASVSSTTVNPYASNVTASASATITATSSTGGSTTPTVGDGPKVVGVARSGVGNQATKYAVGFDSALFVAPAQNLANYSIVDLGTNGKKNTTIAIKSAVFNASNNSVTLSPAKKIGLKDQVRLTVNGVAPNGLTNTDGLYLDGAGTGTPGSNYSVTFTGFGPSSTVSTSSAHPKGPKTR